MTQDSPRITLITKPGCHLCALARDVISRVSDDLSVEWEEVSIETMENPDPLLWEQIPVTLIDGEPHDYWRVSESRLRTSLASRIDATAKAD
ncbi:MAG: glutaredoxin family protein [Dermatophilus congolensis]|nr:glutaredoxin family protein [Dermatophilus congolensis]